MEWLVLPSTSFFSYMDRHITCIINLLGSRQQAFCVNNEKGVENDATPEDLQLTGVLVRAQNLGLARETDGTLGTLVYSSVS